MKHTYIVTVRTDKRLYTLRVRAESKEQAIEKALASDKDIIDIVRVTKFS